jgi:hypothetical protein
VGVLVAPQAVVAYRLNVLRASPALVLWLVLMVMALFIVATWAIGVCACAQAMDEMEEWTQNKSLIDTSKGLTRSIPSGFPYFHVSWTGGGYAHIIEDEERFQKSFGGTCFGGPYTQSKRAVHRRPCLGVPLPHPFYAHVCVPCVVTLLRMPRLRHGRGQGHDGPAP